jgi:hypothetical protein
VESPKIRELFVEELAEVTGGAKGGVPGPPTATTLACCEEGPFGCCGEVVVEPI